jgi:redox-sensitive bicupin YhaK (pirin superfamily)
MVAGKPIREPVVKYGPFVMNTEEQIKECFRDYQRGQLTRKPCTRVKYGAQ